MTSQEVRQRFLDFFEKREHAVLPSASLVPENDPSALFTTAGVQPLVPYILQGTHPQGNRLASVQKCVRTTDINDIGDKTHATFFEMLGNWSIGDYFKEDAIKYSWLLLTDEKEGFGEIIKPERLYVTVYKGDGTVPKDEESIKIWSKFFKDAGLNPQKRIFELGDDNFWPKPKKNDTYSGPCGPSTEMFYDLTEEGLGDLTHEDFLKADEDQKIVEIWNDVFMEYKKEKGEIIGKLEKQHVDTGSGLERLLTVLQGKDSIFETDLFAPLMDQAKTMTNTDTSARILSDHIRTASFMIVDGVVPSNTDQGYVLRRLLRRAVFHTTQKTISTENIEKLVETITNIYGSTYPEFTEKKGYVVNEIVKELEKFEQTIQKGMRELQKIEGDISGKDAFILFSSYGFPLELTLELALEAGKQVDVDGFEKEMTTHQEKSKTSSAGKFKGGLGGHSEIELKYHTATHLLNSALRVVLGDHIEQKGSNINPERLRFDFSHPEKMTDEEKQQVTDLVNRWIADDYAISCEEMTLEEAKLQRAIGVFGDKYGDRVKVYSIGDVSKEICGGPHVERTGSLGTFRIKKEEASSAGVRRIKAVLE